MDFGGVVTKTLDTAWLYAYSPNAGSPQYTYFTVFTGTRNGAPVLATISLSYLTTLSTFGLSARGAEAYAQANVFYL
jgi:hypothetical protein